MIPKECKRLAEVDFPIAAVSAHAVEEKKLRDAHPANLHLWWARRPLAACRSMLMALLLPDPGDPLCPVAFKKAARELLKPIHEACNTGTTDDQLRRALLNFIAQFADWDNASNALFLSTARGLVKAAHPEEEPLVVDPFAGGGAIPLEALRLGCEAFASDLNPVACLINKVLLEDIPRHGPELAEQLREAGEKVKKAAATQLASFYPPDPDGAKPIAYLWARTVRCESPDCGAEIPLIKSFCISKKESRLRALRPVEPCKPPLVEFEVFTPKSANEVRSGTVSKAKATCLCCGKVLPPARVCAQLAEQRGGADVVFGPDRTRIGGAKLLAVVTLKDGQTGRSHRAATEKDYEPVWLAQQRVKELGTEKRANGMSPIPDEPLPPVGTLGFRVQRYGMLKWGDLFSARQKLAFRCVADHLELLGKAPSVDAICRLLALAMDKATDLGNSLTRWKPDRDCPVHLFGRQAVSMVWDSAESVLTSESSGSFQSAYERSREGLLAAVIPSCSLGTVSLADATQSPLNADAASIWFTDPPYYDAIPYSDLSDFFLVWLKRTLPGYPLLRDPFDPTNPLSPKLREAVQDETKKVDGKPKDRAFFEATMGKAFAEGRRVLKDDGIGCVVFAHKTTEGWEALLSGLIAGGWTITGSWPISTEMATRLRARESAALATSVHLVCRPRPAEAKDGDWSKVQKELVGRIDAWMKRLQAEGVRGADLVFACIGPALEVYSKHPRVLDAEDRPIPLGGDPEATEPHERGFLAYVWELVGRAALAQVLKEASGSAAGLEEDARLTALFLWTLQATTTKSAPVASEEPDEDNEDEESDEEDDAPKNGKKAKGFSLPFDVARRFAQPLGIHLDEWENRVIATTKGVVRLLPVIERADQLFGKGSIDATSHSADSIAKSTNATPSLPGMEPGPLPPPPKKGKGKGKKAKAAPDAAPPAPRERTTLDRVHAAMLLQNSGQTAALKALLKDEQDRGPAFLRLANALYPLYPDGCEEKRLLQALLLHAGPKK